MCIFLNNSKVIVTIFYADNIRIKLQQLHNDMETLSILCNFLIIFNEKFITRVINLRIRSGRRKKKMKIALNQLLNRII